MAISKEQLDEFKDRVLGAKRPLFFYDDDADGLCSYLLCYKARGDGLGVRVHGSASVTIDLLRKVEENIPDIIVILDKPYAEQAFIDAVSVPVLWLDHHEPQKPEGVTYLNPRIDDDEDNKSTSYWVYKALGRKEDLWLAAIGNITDWQITEVAAEFMKKYPELLKKASTPPEAMYSEPFCTLTRLVQFNLKGDSTEVRTAIKILSRIDSPEELLEHTTPRAKLLYKRYEKISREYGKYFAEASKAAGKDELLFHSFTRMETSLLSELSNQLLYEHPDKVIFLTRQHNGENKLSIRSSKHDVASAVKAAMEGVRGNAGGHTFACGGNINSDDFPKFLEAFKVALNLE